MNADGKESRFIKSHGGKRPGSGRPSGSPNKLTRPLKEAAAMESEACLATLVHLRDHGESEQVRLAAATAILDRGHGRPRQEVNLTDGAVTIVVNRIPVMPSIAGAPLAIDHQALESPGAPISELNDDDCEVLQ